MKSLKRSFSLFLALLLALSAMSLSAFAGTVVPVAQIGSQTYGTLTDAIAAVPDNTPTTITLLADVKEADKTVIEIPAAKNITLNLNGKTITNAGGTNYTIVNSGTLTVNGNGTIKSSYGGFKNNANGNLTLSNLTVEATWYGLVFVSVGGYSTATVKDGVVMNIGKGGIIFSGNGTAGQAGHNVLNIEGGTFNCSGKDGNDITCGIYCPNEDTINVTGGTFNIGEGAAVLARAGCVNISGGTFNVTGSVTGKVGDCRAPLPCSALVFDSYPTKYPHLKDDSVITVTGGTFNCEQNAFARIVDTELKRIVVKDGTFSTDPSALRDPNVPDDPNAYVPDTCEVKQESGKWAVHEWNTPTYTWAADHSTVTATRTCKHNASHIETETVAATAAVTTEPTYTANGEYTYTGAAFTNKAFAAQTATESIPMLVYIPVIVTPTNPTDNNNNNNNQNAQEESGKKDDAQEEENKSDGDVNIEEESVPLAELPANLTEVTVSINGVEVSVSELPVPYEDVDPEDWSSRPIAYVTALGIMNGVGEGEFAPKENATPNQLVTMLYRAETGTETSGENWSADATVWSETIGLTEDLGIEDAEFVTREQMVTMMFRIAKAQGFDVSASDDLAAFEDSGDLSEFALAAMKWAVGCGLIKGTSDSTLSPDGLITREQIATIMMRFHVMTTKAG